MALINTTTKAEFDDKVVNSKKVVLVDFWAKWCPPCRAMAPVLEKVAKELDDVADIVKVDIEESTDNSKLAGEYEVRSIPNMNIFKDGKVVDTIVGMVPDSYLVERLKSFSN